mmetsp:Transcript_31378/g.100618  ORF Transcript_31378/g.100618 Transcript_31378/m.100618 type:complete len:94 (+) Transcript_31378:403-684(+)
MLGQYRPPPDPSVDAARRYVLDRSVKPGDDVFRSFEVTIFFVCVFVKICRQLGHAMLEMKIDLSDPQSRARWRIWNEMRTRIQERMSIEKWRK